MIELIVVGTVIAYSIFIYVYTLIYSIKHKKAN